MTSEDDYSLSEEELDGIAKRVAEQLGDGGNDEDAGDDIEVHVDDEGSGDELGDGFDELDEDADGFGEDVDEEEATGEKRRSEAEERARRKREEAKRRKREAKRRAQEAREAASGLEDLGERIEATVEAQLEHLGEHLEHSLEHGLGAPTEPAAPGVVIGPDDAREKAVYKTQLQKGGRVAVPDTEIEALDLEPGDTLQVVLYPLD